MRKKILITLSVSLTIIISFISINFLSAERAPIISSFQLAKERSNLPKNSGDVIAIVGNQKIYESELERMMMGYEHRQNIASTNQQTTTLTQKQQEELALEQLIEKERVRCFCRDNNLIVSDEEADQLRITSEKILAEQVANGDRKAIEMQQVLDDQKKGSGLNDKEYSAMIREGYRDLLLGKKIDELYQDAKSSYSFDEWWKMESSYIKIEIK